MRTPGKSKTHLSATKWIHVSSNAPFPWAKNMGYHQLLISLRHRTAAIWFSKTELTARQVLLRAGPGSRWPSLLSQEMSGPSVGPQSWQPLITTPPGLRLLCHSSCFTALSTLSSGKHGECVVTRLDSSLSNYFSFNLLHFCRQLTMSSRSFSQAF